MKRLNVLFSVICFLFMALMTACQDDVLTPVQEEEKTEQNGYWIKEVDEQGRIIGETKYTTTKTANVSGTGTYTDGDKVNLSTTSGYTLYYRQESSSSYTSANGSTHTIKAMGESRLITRPAPDIRVFLELSIDAVFAVAKSRVASRRSCESEKR